MKNNEPIDTKKQEKSLLEEIIREGARKVLQAAIENEVSAYIDLFKDLKDEQGRRGTSPSRVSSRTICSSTDDSWCCFP